ncbi:MAG: sensor histidine kinase [Dyadobacter sp.]|uniref:tetratricopeptide repeat-containing sensor histidine kinase n=1 Tax=Dyadobacter sp. TaxID=1914288 RepID=UPI0032634209
MKKWLILFYLLAHAGGSESADLHDLKMQLDNVRKLPQGYSQDTLRFGILRNIMRYYADNNLDSAFHYKDLIIKHCKAKGLENEIIYAYYYTGILYQIKSEFYQSVRFYHKALSLAKERKQYNAVASAYAGLAHTYSRLDQNYRALINCKRGLSMLNRLPDSTSYSERLALLNVQGVIYRKLDQFDDALKVNIAMYNLSRAKPYDPWYEAHGLHAIGLVYKELGDLPRAMDYHKKALRIAAQARSVELEGNILINIADLCLRSKRWSQALNYINRARRLALGVQNSGIVTESYEKSYTLFKATNRPDMALSAYEKFVSLRDSLLQEKNQQRIDDLEEKYANIEKVNLWRQRYRLMIEKAYSQHLEQTRNYLFFGITVILLIACLLVWNNRKLQGKNRELRRKNEEIKKALFKGQTIERKRVALELHDNLGSLLSAVNMSVQSMNPQNLTVPEQSVYQNVRHLIKNAYAEVRNISHNILPAELEKEGLCEALEKLVERLNQNLPIKFTLNIIDLVDRLPVEIEYNLYSIILELVNNAAKHAKADSIVIQLVRSDWGVDLSVTDDGIGLQRLGQKRGVGLQNVNTRLESLGGTIHARQGAPSGTRIDVKIPIETARFEGDTGTTV